MAADLLAGRGDPAVVRHRRGARRVLLGLGGRQDRPPQGLHPDRAQRGAGHRHHGAHPRPERLDQRLAVPGGVPPLGRHRQCGALRGRHAVGAGIHADQEARLGRRADHHIAASGQHARRRRWVAPGPDHRLARHVPLRPGADRARADGALLGAGIAALADAEGPARGGAQIAGLGVDGRSEGDRPADDRSRGREGVVVGTVQISPQRHRRLPGRPDPDRRRRARAVGRDPVRARRPMPPS